MKNLDRTLLMTAAGSTIVVAVVACTQRHALAAEQCPVEKEEGFVTLFNGKDLTNWAGDIESYITKDVNLVSLKHGAGNIYTLDDYADFVLRFELKQTPGANNGLGIRTPLASHAASEGMEIQIIDNTAEVYKDLKAYQYHGSIYGVVPAKRGHLKEVGEWNYEEVIAKGRQVTV